MITGDYNGPPAECEDFAALVATHVVRLDLVAAGFGVARAVRWSVALHHAAVNPYWCATEAYDCRWIVWPAGDPGDWCCVGSASLRFLGPVGAPAEDADADV